MSLNYSEWDEDFNFPYGVEFELGDHFSVRPMYDGQRTHLVATWAEDRHSVSLLWVWTERFGVAYSVRF